MVTLSSKSCGIYIDASKDYIIEIRLEGLVLETGSGNFAELYYLAKADSSNGLRSKKIKYETKDYLKTKIIDIDKAAN
jgi:hypothetical protein